MLIALAPVRKPRLAASLHKVSAADTEGSCDPWLNEQRQIEFDSIVMSQRPQLRMKNAGFYHCGTPVMSLF